MPQSLLRCPFEITRFSDETSAADDADFSLGPDGAEDLPWSFQRAWLAARRLLAGFAILLGGFVALPSLAQGEIYQAVEVRGAELVPEEDIARTCGDLTGIEVDAMTRAAVEDCLMSTGVFTRVALIPEGEVLVIDVTEVEARPGRLDFGIAWESDTGLFATMSYEQMNLIPNTYISIRSQYSHEYRSYDVNLYRREAFGPKLHFGLQLSGARQAFDDLAFETESDHAEIYAAWTPTEALRAELALGYRRHALFNVTPAASALLLREAGTVEAPYLHFVLAYATDATEKFGYDLRADQYFWNLGSDTPVSETRLEANLRRSLSEPMTLLASLKGGWVSGQNGQATTALDRLYLGGESLRGFAPRGIGPKDRADHLGGNRYASASLELQRRLGSALDTEFRGGIFFETGALWGLDDTLGGAIDDRAHLRSSLGLTLSFEIGEVPVSLYLAKPVQQRQGDETQVFGLTAAARF